jgi:hypothetical protein
MLEQLERNNCWNIGSCPDIGSTKYSENNSIRIARDGGDALPGRLSWAT